MVVIRKRLIYWLVREYIKKWGRRIVLFFFLGLGFFFIVSLVLPTIIAKIPAGQKESIGLVGAYTVDRLPQIILDDISSGLTTVDENGKIKPALAKSWRVHENGTGYIFDLKDGVTFSDGTKFTSKNIDSCSQDVTVYRPSDHVIAFKLKEEYAPFLTTVSSPIFRKNFVGLGEYSVKDIQLNGNFVESITLSSRKNKFKIKKYQFYPSSDSLKTAYSLGEVSKILGISDVKYKNTSLEAFPNTTVKKTVDYHKLVTIFYNTQDKVLSDKKIRTGLSYTIPDKFTYGERAYGPYPPVSWANRIENSEHIQDFEHARLLLSASSSSEDSSKIKLVMKVLPKYRKIADEISSIWNKNGVEVKIEEVNTVPDVFQVFLGDFNIPDDPDQYSLWHSQQGNNISNYTNLRIDKLLEDGRKTFNIADRQKIYSDFQKYLIEDQPATFLYFPYEYEIIRK
ncbi:MAG: ABC transporter substrate-binding protein [Patescibacteria group bacterium]|nr:ABC transporter substrate-binding protein [Patescibacteria group bacterium]